MSDEKWESVGCTSMWRVKVNGGYLYQYDNDKGIAMCFVPDVDLQRYQAHLRDAYKQGYDCGQEDAKLGHNQSRIDDN